MEQLSSIKIKLIFSEYSELVEKFNNLVKENGFKPLYYKDYRKIAGKLCKENPEEVIIEFINYESFKIIFCPGNTVIYSGSLFDLSFGTFIMDHFRKELKEMNEKNNTYDLWGNAVKCNESAVSTDSAVSSTSNAISSNISNYSDYSNVLGIDYNTTTTSYRSLTQDYYNDIEKKITKLEEEKSKIKVDLDDIHSKLDELLKEITKEYKFDDVNYKIDSILSRVSELEEKNNNIDEKTKCNKRKDNEKTMNTNKMFNFDFGFVDSNIRMSPYGMAIRNADGRYVSYDVKTGSVIDVEPFNFEGNRFMMKMPVAVKDVAVGDIVIHNHKPMFVVNTNDKVSVIDIYNGEEKNILPTINMFNFNYMTKVVSLFNFTGNNTPTAENPFGNIIPFMLMDNENTDMKDLFMMMAITNGGNMNTMFQNPMMMYIMLNNTTEMKEMLPFMMMSGAFSQTPVNNNNNNNNNCNCNCNCNNSGQN